MNEALALLIAYLIGSIPTGFVLARLIAGADLRSVGSGGTGATNAGRVLGSRWGIVIALLDILKGVAAVLVARLLTDSELTVAIAGLLAVVAHCWPVWLGFRGGKGVATGAGAAIALTPWTLIVVPLMIVPIAVTRYVSLGSILATLALPIVYALLIWTDRLDASALVFGVGVALVIVYRHRGNIERLISGTERRLGQRV